MKYDCYETLETFYIENQVQPDMKVLSTFSTHLLLLKNNFDAYFGKVMRKLVIMICNPYPDYLLTQMSKKQVMKTLLIIRLEGTSLKNSFYRKQANEIQHLSC